MVKKQLAVYKANFCCVGTHKMYYSFILVKVMLWFIVYIPHILALFRFKSVGSFLFLKSFIYFLKKFKYFYFPVFNLSTYILWNYSFPLHWEQCLTKYAKIDLAFNVKTMYFLYGFMNVYNYCNLLFLSSTNKVIL